MPYKDPEKQKEAQHRHYLRNTERYKKKGVNWKRTRHGEHRKKYDDLPELGLTTHDQILAAGWLTPQVIAEKYSIPEPSVRNACTKGALNYFRLGRFRVIEPEDAEAWVKLPKGKRTAGYRYPEKVRKPAPYYAFLAALEQESNMQATPGTRLPPQQAPKPIEDVKTARVIVDVELTFTDEFEYAEMLIELRDTLSTVASVNQVTVERQ